MITSNNAALATWVCSGLALSIILSRLLVVRFYRVKLEPADWLAILGIAVIVARLINDYYLLVDGTANDALVRHLRNLNAAQLHQIKIGSILALIARLLDTTFYWLSTATLLLFYSKLLHSLHWATIAIRCCWGLLAATYIAVVVVTFTECHPLHLYWQVYPNPGQCTHAYIQLFLQGSCNILLDLSVLLISVPLLRLQGRSTGQKLRITVMVCLGLICIIITCIRIPLVVQGKSAQPSRTFFASIQILTSAFVANVPTIYGRLQNGRRKRAEQTLRRGSAPELWWSSRSTTRSGGPGGFYDADQSLGLEQKTTRESETPDNQTKVVNREIV
jgi:hypothetical protein